MNSWNNFISKWKVKNDKERYEKFENSYSLGGEILHLLKQNLYDSFENIEKFYVYNSDFIQKNIDDLIIIQSISEITSEIQRVILRFSKEESAETDLSKLAERIINNQNIPDFIKFLYTTPESNDPKRLELISTTKYHELIYRASNRYYYSILVRNASKMVASQYSGEWHFLFELLQNARDAKSKNVSLKLIKENLVFENDGKKFSPMDVWGLLSIGQGHKTKKSIGYFGIGFKSIRKICNSSIIISEPFKFKLNVDFEKPSYCEWDFNEKNLLKLTGKLNSNSFKNRFILESVFTNRINGFIDYLKTIDQKFLLFLAPLERIIISYDNKEISLTSKYEKEDIYEIINIQNELYIKHEVSRDLNLKDDEGNEITEREVILGFKLEKEKEKVYRIKLLSNNPLYAYFPVIHQSPELNFIFHGHFSLINTREDLELNDDSAEWKKQLNQKLIKELGPECFLHLYNQLSHSNKIVFKDLDKLIPFYKKSNNIYSLFREGLIELLKKEESHNIPFWWHKELEIYIPFKNILFVDKEDIKVLKFLQLNFGLEFNIILKNIMNLNLNNKEAYICSNNSIKEFCKEIFPELTSRTISSEDLLQILTDILRDNSPNKKNFISLKKWKGYFNSNQLLKEFQSLLMDWQYFINNESAKNQIFNFFLLIVQDSFGNEYFARINFTNYYYVGREFQDKFPNLLEIFQDFQSYETENQKNLTSIPLFIFGNDNLKKNSYHKLVIEHLIKTRKENSTFLSIYLFLDILNSNYNYLAFKLLYNKLHQLFADIITEINSTKENASNITKFYKLISNLNPKEHKTDSAQIGYLISEILYNLLKFPIFLGSLSKNDYCNLSEFIWGDQKYLDLIKKSNYEKFFNILKDDFGYLNILRQIIEHFNFFEIYGKDLFFKDLKINYISKEQIKKKLEAKKSLILKKSSREVKETFDLFILDEKYENLVLLFFSDYNLFADFSELYYLQSISKYDEIIVVSSLQNQRFYINILRKRPILEFDEKSELYPVIRDKFININIKELKYTWLLKGDLSISLKNSSYFEVIEFEILDLFTCILENYSLLENWEIWIIFYNILLDFFKKNTEKIEVFKIRAKDKLQNFLILNENKDLSRIFPKNYKNKLFFIEDLRMYFEKNRNYSSFHEIIDLLLKHPRFRKNRVHQRANYFWNKLKVLGLIKPQNILGPKGFIKLILNIYFNNEENKFSKLFSDILSSNDIKLKIKPSEFYGHILGAISSAGFSLDELNSYYLMPNLNMTMLKIKEIPAKFNIYHCNDFLNLPPKKISDKVRGFFKDWINPKYFDWFFGFYSNEIERLETNEGVNYNGINPVDFLMNSIITVENCANLPYFRYLFLLDRYFELYGFKLDENLNALKYAIKNLKNVKFQNKKAESQFIKSISKYTIFPFKDGKDWKLTSLDNEILKSRKNILPEFLMGYISDSNYIKLNEDIENYLIDSLLDFDFLQTGGLPSLKIILDNCQNLLNPEKIKNNKKLDAHLKLVNLIFQEKNFKYYYKNEGKKLKNLLGKLKLIILKKDGGKIESKSAVNLYHPTLYKHIKGWWTSFFNIDFPILNILNTIDLEKYDLTSDFIRESFIIDSFQIFINKITPMEVLDLLVNILNKKKTNSKLDCTYIYKNFGDNLSNFLSHDYFGTKNEISPLDLRDKVICILEILIEGMKKETNIFKNYFLKIEQKLTKRYDLIIDQKSLIVENDAFFTPLERIVNNPFFRGKNLKEIDDSIRVSLYSNFKSLKTVTLEDIYQFIENCDSEDIPEIVKAIEFLLKEISLDSQKYNTFYRKLREDFIWFQNKYRLNSFYLKNEELNITPLNNYMKGTTYFNDLFSNIKKFENFLEFFDIKKIELEDLIDYLDKSSEEAHPNRKQIYEILRYLIREKNITKYIKQINQLNIIPVLNLRSSKKDYVSFNHLLDSYTFFSTKKLIIDNLINEWRNAKELKSKNIYILIDNEYSRLMKKWEYVIEGLLDTQKNQGVLRKIEKFPEISDFDNTKNFKIEESNEYFQKEILLLKTIFEYLTKKGAKDAFDNFNIKNVKLNYLNGFFNFQMSSNAYGTIKIFTFDNRLVTLSNVRLIRLFIVNLKAKIVYYTRDLEISDLKKLFFENIFEELFPEYDVQSEAFKTFKDISDWAIDFNVLKLTRFQEDSNLLREYLIKKGVRIPSKAIDEVQLVFNDLITNYIENDIALNQNEDINQYFKFLNNNLKIEELGNKNPFEIKNSIVRVNLRNYQDFNEVDVKDILIGFLNYLQTSTDDNFKDKYSFIFNIKSDVLKEVFDEIHPKPVEIKPLISEKQAEVQTENLDQKITPIIKSSEAPEMKSSDFEQNKSENDYSLLDKKNIKSTKSFRVKAKSEQKRKQKKKRKKIPEVDLFSPVSMGNIEQNFIETGKQIQYTDHETLVYRKDFGKYEYYHKNAIENLKKYYGGTEHKSGVPCQICRYYCKVCEMQGNVIEEFSCRDTCNLIHFTLGGLPSSREFKLWKINEFDSNEKNFEEKNDINLQFFVGFSLNLCHNHGVAFDYYKEEIRNNLYEKIVTERYLSETTDSVFIQIENILEKNREEIPLGIMIDRNHLKLFKRTYELMEEIKPS